MTGMTPRLVKDTETNQICLQITLGKHSATIPVPDGFGRWSDQLQLQFIESVVPEMIEGLQQKIRADQRKLRSKSEADS